MSLASKLAKTSAKGVDSYLGEESNYLTKEYEYVTTPLPIYNLALSGKIDGGLTPGVTILAGKSGVGKTLLAWLGASAFQRKYQDGVVLFYDSEFGTKKEYLKGLGVDLSRVIHIPVTDIEQLNFDIMAKLNAIDNGEKVYILMDSLGQIASKKEVEDALAEKSVQDMSRAKKMKALFRQITPIIAKKELFFVGIAHTYEGQGMFATTEIAGGTGLFYAADTILILSKSKSKEGSEQVGVNINITIRKSRYVKEGVKFTAELNFDTGFKPFSGLIDMLIDLGFVVKPSNGFYQLVDIETGNIEDQKKYRLREIETAEKLSPILSSEVFKNAIQSKYMLVNDNPTIDFSTIDMLK